MSVSPVPADLSPPFDQTEMDGGDLRECRSMPLLERAEKQPLTLLTRAMWLGLTLTAFFGPLDLAVEGAVMTVGLDSRVALKLGAAGYCAVVALYGLCCSEPTRRSIVSLPAALIAFLVLLTLPSGFSGLSSSALPAALINLSYLVFVPTCLVHIGVRRFLLAILTGIICLMSMAWFLYFVVPSYGVFPELLDDGLVVHRLGGVAHPNSVGRLAAMGTIIILYLWSKGNVRPLFALVVTALMLSALIHAQSRTSIIALGVGLLVLFSERLFSRWGIAMAGLMSLGLLTGLLVFAVGGGDERRVTDRLVGLVAKSGDAEELTSGTGRVEIWQKSVSLIMEEPLTGHGFGSATILLIDHSQSTHNVFLHSMMLAGLGGGFVMLVLQGWLLAVAFLAENKFMRSIAAFLLICGLMEETLLETFPGPASMFWLACSLYSGIACLRQKADAPSLTTE